MASVRRLVLTALAFVTIATPVLLIAQVRETLRGDARLKGIREVVLIVSEEAEQNQSCGLSEEALRLEAARALLDGQLKVTQESSGYFLFVDVTTITPADVCASSVDVELATYVEGIPLVDAVDEKGWRRMLPGRMELVRRQTILSSGRSDHAERVRSKVRGMVTDITTRIRLANQ